jgi:hypothetical protein
MCFQHGHALLCFACQVCSSLEHNFLDRHFGCGGLITWLPYLTSLQVSLWECLKEEVMAQQSGIMMIQLSVLRWLLLTLATYLDNGLPSRIQFQTAVHLTCVYDFYLRVLHIYLIGYLSSPEDGL